MPTVLVTGGAGFLGSHLVDRLLADGASVRVFDNLSTGSLDNLRAAARWRSDEAAPSAGTRLEVILGDIRDRELVRRAMRRVEGVFHLAALPPSGASVADPAEFHTVNVQGTLNVLEAALAEGAGRVVFASCASVYGSPSPGLVMMEDGPVQPASLFAASKLAGEIYCRVFHTRHGLETVALRYFTVYGPRQIRLDDSLTVSALIEALRRRRPVIMDANAAAALDFTYVDDAVDATVAAAVAPAAAGQTINIGSGETASVQEVLCILGRLLGLEPIPGACPGPDAVPGSPQPSASRAAELLGYVPRVSVASGLSRVVESVANFRHSSDPALANISVDE